MESSLCKRQIFRGENGMKVFDNRYRRCSFLYMETQVTPELAAQIALWKEERKQYHTWEAGYRRLTARIQRAKNPGKWAEYMRKRRAEGKSRSEYRGPTEAGRAASLRYYHKNRDRWVKYGRERRRKVERAEGERVMARMRAWFGTKRFAAGENPTVARNGVSILEILGVGSTAEFKRYWEGLFKEGMNWDGGWEIGHIRPMRGFDCSDPEKLKECFNYRNLRPESREDNGSRRNEYIAT